MVTTDTSSPAAFLLARASEDEAVARDAATHPPIHSQRWQLSTVKVETIDGVTHRTPRGTVEARPARVLAQVAALRAVVELHRNGGEYGDDAYCEVCHDYTRHDAHAWPCPTILALVQPYAGHPDFDPAWLAS